MRCHPSIIAITTSLPLYLLLISPLIANADIDQDSASSLFSPSFSLSPSFFQFGSYSYFSGSQNVTDLLVRLTSDAMILVMTIAALGIVISGVLIASSGGESKRAESGKTALMFNIYAVLLALMAYAVIELTTWVISGH